MWSFVISIFAFIKNDYFVLKFILIMKIYLNKNLTVCVFLGDCVSESHISIFV